LGEELKRILLFIVYIVGFIKLYPKGTKVEKRALIITTVILVIVTILFYYD